MVDTAGTKLLSRRVETNEAEDLCGLIDEVLFLARGVVWPSARLEDDTTLLLALLWEREQRVVYFPGLTLLDRARDAY